MDILSFVERETARIATVSPDGFGIAEIRLGRSPEMISAIITAWRASGGTSALPLTFEEFGKAVDGSTEPSVSIKRTWSRRLENESGIGFHGRAAIYSDRIEAYERKLANEFTTYAENIAARYAVEGATPLNYTRYLASIPQARKAFFRRWALPFPESASKAHSYIVAATGSGKSELLKATIYERVRRGEGVVLIDPHGDLAEQVARLRIVVDAKDDDGEPRLVYFDPYLASRNGDITPVINPLERIGGAAKERAIGAFCSGLARVVDDVELTFRMKVLTKHVLWGLDSLNSAQSLLTLSNALGNPRNDAEAKQLLAAFKENLHDPIIKKYLETDYLSTDLDKTRGAIRGRLASITMSPTFRNILTGKSTIDLRKEMDRGAILIFNLAHGKTDEEQSVALGKFIVSSLFSAAMERAELNEEERREVREMFVYIDEADKYVNESAEEIMKNTRKYGLFLGLSQQNPLAHMSQEIADTVRQNALIKIIGSSNDLGIAKDAGNMVGVTAAEVAELKTGEFFFCSKEKNESSKVRRAFVHRRLLSQSAYVGTDEWKSIKEEQIKRYYRHHKKEYAMEMEERRERLDTGGRKVTALTRT